MPVSPLDYWLENADEENSDDDNNDDDDEEGDSELWLPSDSDSDNDLASKGDTHTTSLERGLIGNTLKQ